MRFKDCKVDHRLYGTNHEMGAGNLQKGTKMKTYIHYGHTAFIPEQFCPIRNRYGFTKPYGGFWASPIDAKMGWKYWCEAEEFRECKESNAFCFTLRDDSHVLTITNTEQLRSIPQQNDVQFLTLWKALDFETLVQSGVDAVEVTLFADWNLYYELYGWDCDSILIMNPEIIVPIQDLGGI